MGSVYRSSQSLAFHLHDEIPHKKTIANFDIDAVDNLEAQLFIKVDGAIITFHSKGNDAIVLLHRYTRHGIQQDSSNSPALALWQYIQLMDLGRTRFLVVQFVRHIGTTFIVLHGNQKPVSLLLHLFLERLRAIHPIQHIGKLLFGKQATKSMRPGNVGYLLNKGDVLLGSGNNLHDAKLIKYSQRSTVHGPQSFQNG
jgi:hypothetical protein